MARSADPKEKSTYWQLANGYRKLGEPAKQQSALAALKELNDEERFGGRGRTGSIGGSDTLGHAGPN
jgi:hypothetical protein